MVASCHVTHVSLVYLALHNLKVGMECNGRVQILCCLLLLDEEKVEH